MAKAHLRDQSYSKMLFSKLRHGLEKAGLSDAQIAEMLDRESFSNTELWLDPELLGPLIVPAAAGGHATAYEALLQLADNKHGEGSSGTAKKACVLLIERVPSREEYWPQLFTLALIHNESTLMIKSLKNLNELPDLLKYESALFLSWCERLARSTNQSHRRDAYLLRHEGVRLGLVPIPELSFLKHVISEDKASEVCYAAISLLGLGLNQGLYDTETTCKILEDIGAHALTKDMRSRALTMLAFGLNGAPRVSAELLEDIFLRGFQYPDILFYANSLLTKITESNKDRAFRLIKKVFLEKGHADQLTRSSHRQFASRLRTALRGLALRLTNEERRNLLVRIPHMALPDARAILDAVCYRHYHEVGDLIEKFQADPSLSNAIKNVAVHHKKVRRASEGGSPWPELYALFGPSETSGAGTSSQ